MCTGIQLTASDGSVIGARTLEFEQKLASEIIVVPAGTYYPTVDGTMPWTTVYGAVGANAFDSSLLVEGINEKGLSAGAFYFPGYASYTAGTNGIMHLSLMQEEQYVNLTPGST